MHRSKKTTEIRKERLGKNLRHTQNITSYYNLIHVSVALSELFNCFDLIFSSGAITLRGVPVRSGDFTHIKLHYKK